MSSTNFIEFSRPFIEAAKNVFETMVYTKLNPQKPVLKQDNISRGDVSAILGVTGTLEKEDGQQLEIKGMLVISFPYDTYFKVAGAMLDGEYNEYDEEIADLGGEICNMIMGNAKRDLSQMGYFVNMAIPSMVEGSNHTIKYPPGVTIILTQIDTAHGPMFMELCYKEIE